MVIGLFAYYTDRLQQKNYKSFGLSFLRVAISIWLLKEIIINWPGLEMLYGPSTFVSLKPTFIDWIPGGGLLFIRSHYTWFIAAYLLLIFFNVLGIGKWVTALLLFLMVYFFQSLNMSFVNGGDKMARMILLHLVFANSYGHFTLFKHKELSLEKKKLYNLISNLAALSIMLQLSIAYFSAGIAKLNDPLWLHGEATYYAFLMERFMGTSFNKYIAAQKWIDYVTNYGTILFELCFSVFIWIKKMRKPLLIAGLVFHLCIYVFLMIYGFEVVFVLIYGLFLPDKMLFDRFQKVKHFFWKPATEIEVEAR